MEKLGYSVILADSNIFDAVGSADILSNMCSRLIVLTDKEFCSFRCHDNLILNVINTINHEDILYVSKNQAHIYKMKCICEDIACCFVHDKANDYVEVDIQHEITHVMELTRVKRTTKRL